MGFPFDISSRREFLSRLASIGVAVSAGLPAMAQNDNPARPNPVITYPGTWSFLLPKGSIIIVSDQQLDDLTDPDKEVDVSVSSTPNKTTLRQICEKHKLHGVKTLIIAFDEFWSQYRPGQGGKPRVYTPDVEEYISRIKKISDFCGQFGMGLELSLLSPLEIGNGYKKRTGETGRWVQYREGWRDPKTGEFTVQLWEQRKWGNNKGYIELKRTGVRAFAFSELPVGNTSFHAVDPKTIVELKAPLELSLSESSYVDTPARRLTIRGKGDTEAGAKTRVLVVVSYETPEMDYFSPQALPFLQELLRSYHEAGIRLNAFYSDEIHIQGDWRYFKHHDEGQFSMRFLTANFAKRFAELYGEQYADFEKFLVYFCVSQHGFLPDVDATERCQHVMGLSPDDVQRTWLLRRRYFDLLEKTVADLFVTAKKYAEKLYGHELEARAHATWAQSPTIDRWRTGGDAQAPRKYEYTPNFVWSNTVQQASCACSDYFRWNEFLTGGGNDHAEGGWSDRNYYGLALACSTGILNRYPNAYAAAWGMPAAALQRHHMLQNAFGTWAAGPFQAVENCEHRDVEVLMLYPASLVACDERFGSWMVQYGYANYVTPEKLLQYGRINDNGSITMGGRTFTTLCGLFEPLPPEGLIEFLEKFSSSGGRLIWSGPLPKFDLKGGDVRARWMMLCGLAKYEVPHQGIIAAGAEVEFSNVLKRVPKQTILTDFTVDLIYPAEAAEGAEVVARANGRNVGVHRKAGAGSVTYLGFRPRDDQSRSLGYECRTWFEILNTLGAYPASRADLKVNDNPSVVSRNGDYLVTWFPNGAIAIVPHYRTHVESWPGGFHRDPKIDADILAKNPLPSAEIDVKDLAVAGRKVSYRGKFGVVFRVNEEGALVAFSGHHSNKIIVDGREHRFADKSLGSIGWAPVAANRRVKGGAILEVTVHCEGNVEIPVAETVRSPGLYFATTRPGGIADPVPFEIKDGKLCFTAKAEWGGRKLYLLSA